MRRGSGQGRSVNDGSLRSVLTCPFGLGAGTPSPRQCLPSSWSEAPTMPLSEEEPMVDPADPTEGGALELARSAAPAPARRRTALAAVARPAGEVAGLLLVEVLRRPRA